MAKKSEKAWELATGGGLLLGIGLGFFMLPNVFAFVGSLLAGLGLGLIVGAFLKK